MDNKIDKFWVMKENELIRDLKKLIESNASDFLNLPSLKNLDEKSIAVVKANVIKRLNDITE